MLIIPITLVVYNVLRRWQERHIFSVHRIDLPADRRGFWDYLFLYKRSPPSPPSAATPSTSH
jgi:hypothetical protein